jgi:glycosyltransferase involved in cell wall biosynthesis
LQNDVAVVIPAYNRGPLIRETLVSILTQSVQPAEIIVVDDGSTDDTHEIVRSLQTNLIRYHRIENGGAPRARNIGVSLSRSTWIALCDSDDLWLPDKLERQLHLHSLRADCEYSFTNFCLFSGNVWETKTKFDALPPNFFASQEYLGPNLWLSTRALYDRIIRFQPIFPSTVMMTRQFFQRIGRFNETLGCVAGEDFEFTLRCVQEQNIGVVGSALVGIRKHPGNFSGNVMQNLIGESRILRLALRNHSHARCHEEAILKEINYRTIAAAHEAFRQNDFSLTRSLWKEAGSTCDDWKLLGKVLIAALPKTIAAPFSRAVVTTSTLLRPKARGGDVPTP